MQPKNAMYKISLAQTFFKMGKFENAAEQYDKGDYVCQAQTFPAYTTYVYTNVGNITQPEYCK